MRTPGWFRRPGPRRHALPRRPRPPVPSRPAGGEFPGPRLDSYTLGNTGQAARTWLRLDATTGKGLKPRAEFDGIKYPAAVLQSRPHRDRSMIPPRARRWYKARAGEVPMPSQLNGRFLEPSYRLLL